MLSLELPEKLEPLISVNKRYKVFYGGRGGSKSWAFARALIFLALYPQQLFKNKTKIRILCTRELQKSITDSVHKLLSDQIEHLGLSSYFTITNNRIVSVNGSEFIFCGLRSNPLEIKSMEGIDIAWVEEAQKVGVESWRILIPTIRGEDSEIWVSFNPDSPDDPAYKMFVTDKRDDAIVIMVNAEDNPWFPDVLRREMEYDKKYDYQKYLHIWRGEPRIMTDAQVFNGKFSVDNFESKDENEVTYYYGADWGFAQSATALVRCYIYDGFLWIDHEAYSIGTGIEQTPKLFEQVPESRRYQIKADSARPETIKYMNDHGFNVFPTRKGKGSVEDGIEKLRSFKNIIIHERCKHTINEFKLYSYKTDRLTEAILPIIVDAHNHCIDALRYAIEDLYFSVDDIACGIA